jgi:hypothetical protein
MLVLENKKLGLVNAAADGWQDQVRNHIEDGSNFLLILSKDPAEVKNFCNLFGMPDDCTPRALTQAEFFLLGPFIDQEVFDEAQKLWTADKQLVFVEQIDFHINRPPQVKNYLVYSPILGILSQHTHIRPAREELNDYMESIAGKPNPEASVYYWTKGKWRILESGW